MFTIDGISSSWFFKEKKKTNVLQCVLCKRLNKLANPDCGIQFSNRKNEVLKHRTT